LGLGVWGWFHPSDAWRHASVIVGSVAGIVTGRSHIPERARPLGIALAIGYLVLVVAAGPVGAWLAPERPRVARPVTLTSPGTRLAAGGVIPPLRWWPWGLAGEVAGEAVHPLGGGRQVIAKRPLGEPIGGGRAAAHQPPIPPARAAMTAVGSSGVPVPQ
jgi:hypothetical protein